MCPNILDTFPQFVHISRSFLVPIQFSIHMCPYMFDDVEVRGVWWPLQDIDVGFIEEIFYDLSSMNRCIVMLEYEFAPIQPIVVSGLEDIRLKYIHVLF